MTGVVLIILAVGLVGFAALTITARVLERLLPRVDLETAAGRNTCVCCGAYVPGGQAICAACWERHHPIAELPHCRKCGRVLVDDAEGICQVCRELEDMAQKRERLRF